MTDLKKPAVTARPTVIHGAAPSGPQPITGERYVSAEWLALEQTRPLAQDVVVRRPRT